MTLAGGLLKRQVETVPSFHGDMRLTVDLRRGSLHSSFFFFFPGDYEPETQLLMKECVGPGMTVMDIGAHIGFHTLLLASLVGPDGKVYSFEPEPANYDLLAQNVHANGLTWVQPLRLAVSDEDGSAKLLLMPQEDGKHLVLTEQLVRTSLPVQARLDRTVQVPTVTLDGFLEREDIPRVDLLKIDAEESEARILKGAAKALSEHRLPHIVCEIHSSENPGECGQDRVRRILYGYGYKSFYLQGHYKQELKPDEPVRGLQNILFQR